MMIAERIGNEVELQVKQSDTGHASEGDLSGSQTTYQF